MAGMNSTLSFPANFATTTIATASPAAPSNDANTASTKNLIVALAALPAALLIVILITLILILLIQRRKRQAILKAQEAKDLESFPKPPAPYEGVYEKRVVSLPTPEPPKTTDSHEPLLSPNAQPRLLSPSEDSFEMTISPPMIHPSLSRTTLSPSLPDSRGSDSSLPLQRPRSFSAYSAERHAASITPRSSPKQPEPELLSPVSTIHISREQSAKLSSSSTQPVAIRRAKSSSKVLVIEIPPPVKGSVALGSEMTDAQLEDEREGRKFEVEREGPRHKDPRQGDRSPHFKRDIRRSSGLVGKDIRLLREIE